MDYEKKYNEALERARKLKEMYPQDAPGYEEVFPELRESEDERIRKWILEKVQGYADSGIPCPDEIQMANKALAYLEKQKENAKSCDSIPADCTSVAKCEDKSPKHSDSDGTDIRDTPAYWKGWDDAMKQKEQKPAWSEEDEKMRLEAIRVLVSGCERYRRESGCLPSWHIVINWLKSLRPQPHWKPSEDEERLINTSISFLKDFADKGYENAVECIDWLKSKLNGNACK